MQLTVNADGSFHIKGGQECVLDLYEGIMNHREEMKREQEKWDKLAEDADTEGDAELCVDMLRALFGPSAAKFVPSEFTGQIFANVPKGGRDGLSPDEVERMRAALSARDADALGDVLQDYQNRKLGDEVFGESLDVWARRVGKSMSSQMVTDLFQKVFPGGEIIRLEAAPPMPPSLKDFLSGKLGEVFTDWDHNPRPWQDLGEMLGGFEIIELSAPLPGGGGIAFDYSGLPGWVRDLLRAPGGSPLADVIARLKARGPDFGLTTPVKGNLSGPVRVVADEVKETGRRSSPAFEAKPPAVSPPSVEAFRYLAHESGNRYRVSTSGKIDIHNGEEFIRMSSETPPELFAPDGRVAHGFHETDSAWNLLND